MKIKILKERTSTNPINVDLLDPKNPRHIETLLKILDGKVDSDRLRGDIASLQDKIKQAYTWKNELAARRRGHKGYGKNKVYWNPHIEKWEDDQSTGTISNQTGRTRKALQQPEMGIINQDLYNIGKERGIGTHAFRSALNSIANFGLMFADPTAQFGGFEKTAAGGQRAVSSIELYNRATEEYKNKPSIFNGAMVALSALAFIPLVGIIGKTGRAAGKKIKSSIKVKKASTDAIESAKIIRKELYNLPDGQMTPQINKVAEELNQEIIRIEGMLTKRPTAYIRDLQRKINGKVLRALRGDKINIEKAGTPRASYPQIKFKTAAPRDLLGDMAPKLTDTVQVEIYVVSSKRLKEGEVLTKGSYNDYTGTVKITIEVSELNTVRSTDLGRTVIESDPSIFGKIHQKMNATGVHEFIHGSQYRKAKAGKDDKISDWASTSRGGKYISPPKSGPPDGSKGYLQYRNQPVEVEPMARMSQVRPSQIRKNPEGLDTLDRLIKGSSTGEIFGASRLDTFLYGIINKKSKLFNRIKNLDYDMGVIEAAAEIRKFLRDKKPFPFNPTLKVPGETAKQAVYRTKSVVKTLSKEIEVLKKTAPCSAITAFNAYLLFTMGLYDIGAAEGSGFSTKGSAGKNSKLLKTLMDASKNPAAGKKIPVPIYPKGCSYKTLREWEETQDLKLIIEEELDKLLFKR